MKKRVNPVEVERKYDCYIVKDSGNGEEHIVYSDDYDMVIKILMEVDETSSEFKDGNITPEALADKVCHIYPHMKTNMLRPTGQYYKKYHLVLKVLDYYRYIDYHKDGTVFKHEKFKRMTPQKRGIARWIGEK